MRWQSVGLRRAQLWPCCARVPPSSRLPWLSTSLAQHSAWPALRGVPLLALWLGEWGAQVSFQHQGSPNALLRSCPLPLSCQTQGAGKQRLKSQHLPPCFPHTLSNAHTLCSWSFPVAQERG